MTLIRNGLQAPPTHFGHHARQVLVQTASSRPVHDYCIHPSALEHALAFTTPDVIDASVHVVLHTVRREKKVDLLP